MVTNRQNASIRSRPSVGRGEFAVLAVLCCLSGFLLLMENVGLVDGVWRLWPIFPLVLGLGSCWLFWKDGKRDLKPLGIGVYLMLVSLLFFFLNFTSWTKMGKLWPLFIGFFGVALLIVSCYSRMKKWYIVSGLFFIFLSLVFFLVFTVDPRLWPISLVLFGLWILLVPKGNLHEEKSVNS